MQIEIQKVSPVVVEGKFPKMTVNFVREGKNNERKLAGVGETKKVIEVLKGAKEGEIYEIGMEKSADDKFWNWVSAEKTAPTPIATAAKSSYQTKSTYETPEERARKQVYIVRQSSLSNAIEFLNAKGNKSTPKDVMNLAEQFCSFVFQTQGVATIDETVLPTGDDFQDDNPF